MRSCTRLAYQPLVLMVGLIFGALCVSATAATPLPRAGCSQITDAVGDARMPEAPVPPPSDPGLDLTGLALHRTPTSVDLFLRVADLRVPTQQTAAVEYDVSFSHGGRTLTAWVEDFGPAQPLREALPPVTVPKVEQPYLTYGGFTFFGAPAQARVRQGDKVTQVPVTASLDEAHDLVVLSLRRKQLEKALGQPLRVGGTLGSPTAHASRDDSVQTQPYDTLRAILLRLGRNDPCF